MRLTRERALLLTLLIVNIAVWVLALASLPHPLIITVLDVGQGDSILIQAPSGRTMLIDGGGQAGEETRGYDIGREVVLPALMERRVRRIDVLAITHPHADHIGGLRAVVSALPVGMVLDPMLPDESDLYRELCDAVRAKHIVVHRATEGQRLDLRGGVMLAVLSPPDPRLAGESAGNDNSVVLRLTYGDFSMLLAGDTGHLGAVRVARLGGGVRSTVLKVPHHGSEGAVGTGLVAAVRPRLAVISVGANQFGHPSPDTLRELEAVGAKVMRTDRDGAVAIRVEPPRWWAAGYAARGERLSGTCRAAEETR